MDKMKDSVNDIQSALRLKYINLHLHTKYSDGAHKPKTIIERSLNSNLDIISFTDHDSVDAYKHIPSNHVPLRILPGIEISSTWNGYDVHILGYGIDTGNKELNEILKWMKEGRRNRAEKMIDKLSMMGIKIPFEQVLSYTGEMNLVVRPHIARALVAEKHCKTKQEAFEKYIGNDAPAYVPKPILSTADVIDFIHKSGGIAVVAHPGKLFSLDYLSDFVGLGIDGLEVFHPDHNETLIHYFEEFCMKHNLYQTGGSDFHGEEDAHDFFGYVRVSDKSLQDIQEIWNKYKCSKK